MKNKIIILVLIFICSSSLTLKSQNYFKLHKRDLNKTQIVLMHPTASIIESFELLITNKIINIPNVELIGVYHEKEEYDYSKSINYIKEHKIKNFYLHKVSANISVDSIYQKNSCTKDFFEIFNNSNGIIFTGGPDIPPSIYSEKTSLLTEITDPYRHYFELSFLFHLLGNEAYPDFDAFLNEAPKFKIIGICLGMQTMNIATGGTLTQDIPSEIYNLNTVEDVFQQDANCIHKNYKMNIDPINETVYGSLHHIKFSKESTLSSNLKIQEAFTPLIYSAHHQCIKKLGLNLQVEATSIDGKVIEIISHKKFKNVFGVQFHPEKSDIYENKNKFSYNNNTKLFLSEIFKQEKCGNFHKELWSYFLN